MRYLRLRQTKGRERRAGRRGSLLRSLEDHQRDLCSHQEIPLMHEKQAPKTAGPNATSDSTLPLGVSSMGLPRIAATSSGRIERENSDANSKYRFIRMKER